MIRLQIYWINDKKYYKNKKHSTVLRLVTSPMYSMTFTSGAHRRNSRSHVGRVDNGTSNRNGPKTPCMFISAARNAMICIVFPSPISSASIAPFSLHTTKNSHLNRKQIFWHKIHLIHIIHQNTVFSFIVLLMLWQSLLPSLERLSAGCYCQWTEMSPTYDYLLSDVATPGGQSFHQRQQWLPKHQRKQ